MLRSDTTKQWQPDATGKILMERILTYDVAAHRAARYLRSCDQHVLQSVWNQTQVEFHRDSNKYPSVMAPLSRPNERESFRLKCDELCFLPELKSPYGLRE